MKETMRWLDFKVTNRCNNRCVYCGVEQDPPEAQECLDTDTVVRTLQDAIGCGFNFICLLGGEPTIRKDLPEVFPRIGSHPQVRLLLITNLMEFNSSVVTALFATEVGEARVVASLDSLQAPTYKHVPPGTALDHIGRMQELAREMEHPGHRCRVEVHSVISRENWDRVELFVTEMDRRGLDVSLALVCPSVVTDTPHRFNEFRPAELEAVAQQLESLDRQGRLAFANRILLQYVRERIDGIPAQSQECSAGRHQVIVNTDGEVFPCIAESYRLGLRFGNVRNERFGSIYERLQGFECARPEESACWDHYLWSRLVRNYEDEANAARGGACL